MLKGSRSLRVGILGMIGILLITSGMSLAESPDKLLCKNLQSFYDLWKDAAFGNDPNRTEKAAWVILTPEGSYSFQLWPASGARNSQIWRGPIPDHSVALVHTHTVIMDEKPSHRDILVAQKLAIILYVISSKGIWSVAPSGQEEKERGTEWLRDAECNSEESLSE